LRPGNEPYCIRDGLVLPANVQNKNRQGCAKGAVHEVGFG
jgi:hypothetical protein